MYLGAKRRYINTDIHTDRNTDTIIALLRTPIQRGEVIKEPERRLDAELCNIHLKVCLV